MTSSSSDSQDEWSTLHRLVNERWSCRAFLDRQVPRSDIEQLLELARRSASWSNTQPWQVIVTSGEATERFREAMCEWVRIGRSGYDVAEPEDFDEVAKDRRRACARQLYESVGVEWGDRAASAEQSLRNFGFFDAPHVAILTTPRRQGAYALLDTGVYVANFLLGAQAMGLGAIAQAALAEYGAPIREHFGIPEDRSVVLGISFGYPDLEQPVNLYRTARAPLEQTVIWSEG